MAGTGPAMTMERGNLVRDSAAPFLDVEESDALSKIRSKRANDCSALRDLQGVENGARENF